MTRKRWIVMSLSRCVPSPPPGGCRKPSNTKRQKKNTAVQSAPRGKQRAAVPAGPTGCWTAVILHSFSRRVLALLKKKPKLPPFGGASSHRDGDITIHPPSQNMVMMNKGPSPPANPHQSSIRSPTPPHRQLFTCDLLPFLPRFPRACHAAAGHRGDREAG